MSAADIAVSIVGWAVILGFYFGLFLMVVGPIRPTSLPRAPIAALPFVCLRATMTLWRNLRRSQRIRAFLQLADDLRMRQKRVDGFFPRGPRH